MRVPERWLDELLSVLCRLSASKALLAIVAPFCDQLLPDELVPGSQLMSHVRQTNCPGCVDRDLPERDWLVLGAPLGNNVSPHLFELGMIGLALSKQLQPMKRKTLVTAHSGQIGEIQHHGAFHTSEPMSG